MKKISDKICKEFAARHNCLEAHSIDEIRCVLDDAISIPELAASRDSCILSAVPSEEVAKLYDQFDTMRGMFIDSNVGSYSFIQAMVHLGKAMKYFKEFEERRGIAG